MKNFLWGGTEEVKRMNWVAWDIVTRPKKLSGLGTNKLKLANEALLSKWIWRFRSEEDSLWKKVITACHGKRRKWSFFPSNSNLTGVWKNIMSLESKMLIDGKRINLLFKGVLGKGDCIRFWIDVWFENTPLMIKWPLLFALEKEKCCLVKVGPRRLARVVNGDGAGRYSTSSFRSLFYSSSGSNQGYRLWKGGWIKSKCDIFIWRASQDRIPTRQALARRNILIVSVDCILCGADTEIVDHLFSACSIAASVWEKISDWIKIPPVFAFSFGDILSTHERVGENRKAKDIIRGLLMIACWCIWKACNEKFFSNGKGCSTEIFGEVKSIGFRWLKCRSSHKSIVWSEWCKSPMYML
ncbi:uncharacterized protein LOC110893224 [Helianthus annuus]|uniref:uncharacterized protein LOC110893224 n=1 Tax=Helianthus annuus TaxID=4232 RepID=UPI000B8F759F|nr:uncharacterized protein LOC110893224 [Helianthus annuus]